MNWTFAYENHILNNKYQDISDFADAYEKVDKEQLVRSANLIFQPQNAMLFSIGNKKGLSESHLHEELLKL